jgi:SecD/SecF fusion protein
MTNEEVLEQVRIKVKSSIDNAYNVLRNRIDKFGVVQPNIQRLEGTDRILVELPGVKDPERVRKLLQGAAKLEFWETFDNSEVFGDIQKANDKLKDLNALSKGDSSSVIKGDTSAIASVDSSKADTTKLSLAEKLALKNDSAKSDSTGAGQMSDIEAKKQFPLLSVLRPFADQQGRLMPGPRVGYALVSDTGKVNAILNRPEIRASMQRKDVRFLWTAKPQEENKNYFDLIAIKVPRDGNPRLTGDHVTNATVEYGQLNNRPEVSMTMDGPGANIWRRMTKENVKKSIAIVLDDYVYSFPTVQNEIAGGRSSISGNFDP